MPEPCSLRSACLCIKVAPCRTLPSPGEKANSEHGIAWPRARASHRGIQQAITGPSLDAQRTCDLRARGSPDGCSHLRNHAGFAPVGSHASSRRPLVFNQPIVSPF
eukprot:jgi/Mesvir1/22711/Mv25460-RA.1